MITMIPNEDSLNPYSILIAAVTLTRPEDWSNIQHYSWDADNMDEAPNASEAPCHGADVFVIITMTHKTGGLAQVCYDQQDYVYVDFKDVHWSGPLEASVHCLATWSLDFEGALAARKEEVAKEQICVE